MRHVVSGFIGAHYADLVPEARTLRGVDVRSDARLRLHVIRSARYICDLNVAGAGDQPLSIRLFVKHRGNVLREFENMSLLWRTHYADSDRYHIPEPLYVDENLGLLVLRHWPGDSFLSVFYKSAVSGRQPRLAALENYVVHAAGWLADFQAILPPGEKRDPPRELFNFEERIIAVEGLSPSTRKRIIEKLRALQGSIPRLPDTYVHHQYLFRNILYRGGQLCVVDYPHLRIGWPLYDFFTFYTGLERLKQYPLMTARLADHLKALFVRSYFEHRGSCQCPDDLESMWAFFIVEHLGLQYARQKSGRVKRAVNNSFIRGVYAKLADWSRI